MYKYIVSIFAITAAASAHAGTVWYVDLVNTAPVSIVSFEVARAGSDLFHSVPFGSKPLQGGGESATVQIRKGDDDSCRRDLRIRFNDGRVLTDRGFDICAYRSYHAGQYLRLRHDFVEVVRNP